MVHYPKPYAELVRDAHRMRSEYALSLLIGMCSFLARKPRPVAKQETTAEESYGAEDTAKAARVAG